MLFDVLNATDDERDALTRGANERIAGGGHAPKRLVLDLHDLGGDALELLAAVEESLLADDRLGPAVVLLTIDQYRKLPITYAERDLELVKVADQAAVVRALAERPHALVVCSRPPLDAEGRPCFTRWAAISWNRKTLVIEPADAIDRFAREGALPGLASVPDGHRLDALGLVPKPRLEGLPVGPELRSRMEALAAGTLELDPAARLGEALALGIVAASTDAERVRAALASAGLPAEQVTDAAGLERALARARLRAAPPTVLHVSGAWHLVNAEQPAALLGHPRVSVHTISAGPTALSRLAKAVAGRTAVDWELDPRLERAMDELDPARTDEGLAHARSWMAHGGHLVVGENVPCADGVERLRRLLAQPVPRAEQRIEWTRPVGRDGGTVDPVAHVCALSDPEELRQNVWSQFQPVGSTVWHGREEKLTVVWACRTGTVDNFTGYHGDFDERGCFSGSIWEGAAAAPASP
ncbi:MAG: hypothetical protein IPG17_29370 [Sandaracinaceae bacterium]|nr:hypothetical protein [Sandaracinaceae bacterium]